MENIKLKIKGNTFYIYCESLTDTILNKVNEILKINDNTKVEVVINNKVA